MPPPRRPGITLSSGAMRSTVKSTRPRGLATIGPASGTASRREIRRRGSRTTSPRGPPEWASLGRSRGL
eukprot:13999985-Alexandrium_andersonii.AAC.1